MVDSFRPNSTRNKDTKDSDLKEKNYFILRDSHSAKHYSFHTGDEEEEKKRNEAPN